MIGVGAVDAHFYVFIIVVVGIAAGWEVGVLLCPIFVVMWIDRTIS